MHLIFSILNANHCAGTYNVVVTLLAAAYFGFYKGTVDLGWIYDNFLPLLTAAVLFSFVLSIGLYLASYRCCKSHPSIRNPLQITASVPSNSNMHSLS